MKENKSIYIVGIFMLITMVSIGYALLSGQLNINGSAKINAAKWEIYFANVRVKSGSVTASVKPSIIDKTTVNFEVELSKPGDFYEFNVDVINKGMIDAMVESINITPELTVNQQKYLNYSITYVDDVPVEVKDILHANKARTLKVRVEYLKSVENSELNSTDETLNIKATIKYVQADSTAKESISNEITPKFVYKITGDGTNIGDELAIGDEHFYVISNDGTNITMLSKYNLNATTPYDSSMTYIQNTDNTTSPVAFHNGEAYWDYRGGYNIDLSGASINYYISNYRNYLESLGADVTDARLIYLSEFKNLGCLDGSGIYNNCNNAPDWINSTNYWSGTTYNNYDLRNIFVIGNVSSNTYNSDNNCGVRPVIVIPADSI